jgi:hypothetical protein
MDSLTPTGLMNMGMFEGTKKDKAQDKKLAKKRGLSLKSWEKSKADEKHDKQQSMKGLKGGGLATKGKGVAFKSGGLTTRGMGRAYKKGGKVC